MCFENKKKFSNAMSPPPVIAGSKSWQRNAANMIALAKSKIDTTFF